MLAMLDRAGRRWEEQMTRKKVLPQLATWIIAGMLTASAYGEDAKLDDTFWEYTPEIEDKALDQDTSNEVTAPLPQQANTPKSRAGIPIGGYVKFRGVGIVFYAGESSGDVYFASQNEIGGYDWEEANEACRRKGTGWVLPDRRQLNLLHENADMIDLYAKGIRESSGQWYWTSTEVSGDEAWRQRFYDGFQQPLKKRFSANVVCARVY